MKKKEVRKKQSGFTLVELLVVIVVIAIIAAISVMTISGVQSRAIDSAGKSDMKNTYSKLKIFEIDNSRFPTIAELPSSVTPPSTKVYDASKTYNLVYCVNTDPANVGKYVFGARLKSGAFAYTTADTTGLIPNAVFTSRDDICGLGNVPSGGPQYIYCGKSADLTATWPIARPGTFCGL